MGPSVECGDGAGDERRGDQDEDEVQDDEAARVADPDPGRGAVVGALVLIALSRLQGRRIALPLAVFTIAFAAAGIIGALREFGSLNIRVDHASLVSGGDANTWEGLYIRRTGDTLYVAGQLGRDPATAKIVPGGIEAETRQTLANIREVMNLANQEFEATAEQYRLLARKSINQADLRKYVKLVLKVEDRQVTATDERRSLAGTLEGTEVRGTWRQEDGGGDVVLSFSPDFGTFKARYNHAKAPGEWKRRMSSLSSDADW